MIQGRNQKGPNEENFITQNNDQFFILTNSLLNQFGLTSEELKQLEGDFSFKMNFNEISAQRILDEVEAKLINERDQSITVTILNKCLEECVTKIKGKKKYIQPKKNVTEDYNDSNNFDKNIRFKEDNSNIPGNNQMITEDENKEISVEIVSSFNEKNLPNPYQYNSKEIACTFFSNLEIKEYSVVPKDDEVYYEEYTNYFRFFKQQFLEAIGIDNEDPLLDVDKFFLLVTFANYEGKPILQDMELVDPLTNFTKYNLKIENENLLKDYYFFTGQIVFIEGHLKNKEIFAQKIVFGLGAPTYSVSEPYVRGFFQDSNPFLIYAVNGPIFNKTNVNMNTFLKTLNYIANENPHALIINGPILTCDNAMIMSGDIVMNNGQENCLNYFELFELILNKINEIFNDKRTTIILSPSLSDMTNFYPLPQPGYNLTYLKHYNNLDIVKKGKLKLIGNPQIFQLNETIIGVANFDVIRDMISTSVRSPMKVPLDSSLEMLIQQRNFYPILPNSVNSDEIDKMDKTISVDLRKLKDLHFDVVPDIIITPTWNISPFVRKVNSTLFINPGFLFKNNNPGSFVKITSFAPNNSTGVDILNRVKVDVMKISFK